MLRTARVISLTLLGIVQRLISKQQDTHALFCVLSDEADYLYQVTEYFQGAETPSVAWNDPDLAIPWPVTSPVLSAKDQAAPTMRQLFPDRFSRR